MKKNYYLISIILFVHFQLTAQQVNSHQSQPPPLNMGSPFTRGMYIDCTADIVDDIANGDILGLKQELLNYIRANNITYAILCGLEHANIFGNPVKETALLQLITTAKNLIPLIRFAVSGSDAENFTVTPNLTLFPSAGSICFPIGTLNTLNAFNDALNNSGANAVNQKRAELCKFFLRAAIFGSNSGVIKASQRCTGVFDALYLEYRYWNQTSSLTAMQNEFTNFKTLLSVMKVIKCKYNCILKVDAEFLPTDLFKLQAWTAIDQITEADPLADRLMIPSFTNNATGVFDNICKTLHFLSDRFSKPRSELFIEVSAESSSFNYCSSTLIPPNYLGDYLNGTVTPSGNMYSVEKLFLDKFNNPNYFCSSCSCYPYADNHYSITNIYGNTLSGMVWRPYSMLNDHNLFKSTEAGSTSIVEIRTIMNQLIDINGRVVENYILQNNDEKSNATLSDGIYFHRIVYSNGNEKVNKIFIHNH